MAVYAKFLAANEAIGIASDMLGLGDYFGIADALGIGDALGLGGGPSDTELALEGINKKLDELLVLSKDILGLSEAIFDAVERTNNLVIQTTLSEYTALVRESLTSYGKYASELRLNGTVNETFRDDAIKESSTALNLLITYARTVDGELETPIAVAPILMLATAVRGKMIWELEDGAFSVGANKTQLTQAVAAFVALQPGLFDAFAESMTVKIEQVENSKDFPFFAYDLLREFSQGADEWSSDELSEWLSNDRIEWSSSETHRNYKISITPAADPLWSYTFELPYVPVAQDNVVAAVADFQRDHDVFAFLNALEVWDANYPDGEYWGEYRYAHSEESRTVQRALMQSYFDINMTKDYLAGGGPEFEAALTELQRVIANDHIVGVEGNKTIDDVLTTERKADFAVLDGLRGNDTLTRAA